MKSKIADWWWEHGRLWHIVALLIASIMLIVASTVMIVNGEGVAFDHSQCQYPVRASNPPDGCDNSDPAEPEKEVKGMATEQPAPQVTKPVIPEQNKRKECTE